MNYKLKIVAVLVVAVLSAGGSIFYAIQQAKVLIVAPKPQDVSLPVEPESEEKVVTIYENFPEEITGKVVGITPSAWIVDQPSGATQLGIRIDTPVFKYEGGEKRKISITDVVAGHEITAKLNRETGAVLEAIIVK